MTRPLRFAPLFALSLVFGCSSGSFAVAGGDDASSDAAPDSATIDSGATDAAADAVVSSDASGDAQPSGDAGGFECRNPGDCSDVRPFCCATFDLGDGTLPNCPMSNASTKCQATCPTLIPLSCPASGRVKVCRDSNDCTGDPAAPKCCMLYAGGTLGSVCVPEYVASYANSCN